MKGFSPTKQKNHLSAYWVACYAKDNEDEPVGIHKKVLSYKPGQDKDALMTKYCHSIMKINKNVWEILVHQGPSEIPDSGDQIVIRLSREPFKGCSQLTNNCDYK
jgi:hypothetical protein